MEFVCCGPVQLAAFEEVKVALVEHGEGDVEGAGLVENVGNDVGSLQLVRAVWSGHGRVIEVVAWSGLVKGDVLKLAIGSVDTGGQAYLRDYYIQRNERQRLW